MDKRRLEYFKKLLLEEKNKILETISKMNENEPNTSMQDYFDELSMYDNHPADIGTETFMMGQMMNLKNNEQNLLMQIEDSLNRIENGTYGICEKCGKKINEERLEIIPYAKFCIECANREIPLEKTMDYRPVEEEVLGYPFGRSYKDVTIEDEVEFDGEDSWQAVARFNEVKGDPSYSTGDNQGGFDEKEAGIVEEVDKISNEYYKGQLKDLNREDIPEEQKEQG
ncbi:TraR/DksA C4-type zinc finger protein [Caloranaerobacter ferrireducens]|uniref:TraR/DksA C4-type zinc finger protein n=1 Tax=Caloranaerobacter ferrireducens TaxID=1323370 RepID=UPI00084E0341|nr:TraR/DksA C4-type zinc finger protein [Caloranaerobacter ferrireducens]